MTTTTPVDNETNATKDVSQTNTRHTMTRSAKLATSPKLPKRRRRGRYGRSRQWTVDAFCRDVEVGLPQDPTPKETQDTSTTNTKSNLSPTRHKIKHSMLQKSRSRRPDFHRSVTPCAIHRYHLPGPPPRHTTAHSRAATPHGLAVRSPSCTGQLLVDHGRHTSSEAAASTYWTPLGHIHRADNLAA